MESIKRLGKDTLIYGIGQVISKLISFLLLPLLTNYLSPIDYGIISLLAVLSFIVVPLFGLGLGVSLGIFYFREEDHSRAKLIWTVFIILLISSGSFITIILLFTESISVFLLGQSSSDNSLFLVITAFSAVIGQILNQPFISRLQFENRSKEFVYITTITTIINILLTILLVVIFSLGVKGFLIASLLSSVISFSIYLLSIFSWTPFSIDFKVTRQLLALGLPLVPSFIFLFFIQNSGRYFLQNFRGLSDVGIYSIGNSFAMAMNMAVSAFTTAWFPYFSSFINRQEEAKSVFSDGFTYFVLSLGSLCVIIFLLAKPMVLLMTASEFHSSYKIIGILSLGYFLLGTFSILTSSMYFAKKTYLVNIVQLAGAVGCVLLSYLLIPIWGIVGASISFASAVFIVNVFQFYLNKKLGFLDIPYDWVRVLQLIGIFFVFGIVSLLPRGFNLYLEIFLSGFLIIVFICLMFLKLKPQERRFVRSKILEIKNMVLLGSKTP